MQSRKTAFDDKSSAAPASDKKPPAPPSRPAPLDSQALRHVVGGRGTPVKSLPGRGW
jgi:hypothetical protein